MSNKKMVSGILLKGNNARFVTLFGSRENHSIESPKFNKLSLPKDDTSGHPLEYFIYNFIVHHRGHREIS